MVRMLRSFLVRWWVLDDGSARIELTHIQSDARVITGSVAEALAWINLIAEGDAGITDAAEAGNAEDEDTPPGEPRWHRD